MLAGIVRWNQWEAVSLNVEIGTGSRYRFLFRFQSKSETGTETETTQLLLTRLFLSKSGLFIVGALGFRLEIGLGEFLIRLQLGRQLFAAFPTVLTTLVPFFHDFQNASRGRVS